MPMSMRYARYRAKRVSGLQRVENDDLEFAEGEGKDVGVA
jgi:hypothetical protein